MVFYSDFCLCWSHRFTNIHSRLCKHLQHTVFIFSTTHPLGPPSQFLLSGSLLISYLLSLFCSKCPGLCCSALNISHWFPTHTQLLLGKPFPLPAISFSTISVKFPFCLKITISFEPLLQTPPNSSMPQSIWRGLLVSSSLLAKHRYRITAGNSLLEEPGVERPICKVMSPRCLQNRYISVSRGWKQNCVSSLTLP